MSHAEPVIGIDLGGTKLALGAVQGGQLLERLEQPTPQDPAALVDLLVDMVGQLDAAAGRPLPLGLGVPGPVKGGQTTFFSNIQGLSYGRLEVELAARLDRVIPVENDANLAALAEARYGSARGTQNSVYLTWSTGIGCGLILGGQPYAGRGGMAGEVGHTRMNFLGIMDGSGTQGTLEAQASGASLARDASFVFGKDLSVPDVFQLADQGDAKARGLLKNAASHLGLFLHNLQLLLDPEVIVLGGGLLARADALLPLVEEERQRTGAISDFTPIKLATLGNDAGIIGAAEFARLNTK